LQSLVSYFLIVFDINNSKIYRNNHTLLTLIAYTMITGFVTRLTRRVPLVEQVLLTLPEHLSSPPVFSGVHVTRSLVLCLMFCRSLFVLLSFFFWPLCCLFFFDIRIMITSLVSCVHCVVCSSSIYGFWLPPFGILWPLCCLFFFDIRILITSLWYLQTLHTNVTLNGIKDFDANTYYQN
jgi:hypothetical protein